jgi:hypothetical protein
MDAKRRLPLVPSAGDADADPERAPWQWVGFGTVTIFVVWLPLSAAASGGAAALVRALSPASSDVDVFSWAMPLFVGLSALALGVAAFVGGFVVGRWGGRGVGVRQAALSGLVAAAVAVIASWTIYGIVLSALVIVLVALAFAALGGKLGRKVRH